MKINKSKCSGCGICKNICSYNAIEIKNGKANFNENCIGCKLCISSCPLDAIYVEQKPKNKTNSKYRGIYIFVDKQNNIIEDVSYQLVSKSKQLAKSINSFVASIVINSTEQEQKELTNAGSDKIINIKVNSFNENSLAKAQILADISKEYKPNILLLGATPDGRSIAPRVAAKLKTGLTADCTKLNIKDNLLVQTRPAYGGNILAEIICPNNRPQMATVRPNIFKVKHYNIDSEIIDINYKQKLDNRIRVLDTLYLESTSDLEHAELVIGAGRGINTKETLKLVFEFAKLINASVAASRPLVDSGWMEYNRQIGQTGKTISPKIYIACGISGAIQHMAGISEAETIIAINDDIDANIFNYSDYSILGDVGQILKHAINILNSDNNK